MLLKKTDQELNELFKRYEALTDIAVFIKRPVEYENKAVYLGEWYLSCNLGILLLINAMEEAYRCG